jgi:hypothetical protein
MLTTAIAVSLSIYLIRRSRMTRSIIAQLEFIEALTDDEVFMCLCAYSEFAEFVQILLTGRHHGDIDVYLLSNERKAVVQALEEAAQLAQGANTPTDREIANLRYVRDGTKVETVIKVRVEKGLVRFDLALEGDENEEDWVWVYLNDDQCSWLIEALRKAV